MDTTVAAILPCRLAALRLLQLLIHFSAGSIKKRVRSLLYCDARQYSQLLFLLLVVSKLCVDGMVHSNTLVVNSVVPISNYVQVGRQCRNTVL